MDTLPADAISLLILTFVLGMKHGFDADHLATIDGLTRFNTSARPGMARWCGTLFSLGHGLVVTAIAVVVTVLAGHWNVPEWFVTLGALISIAFLFALAGINFTALLRASPGETIVPIGLKGGWLGKWRHASHPALIMLVGALFALSFDTLSQAAFFALTATQFGGWPHALLLAALFTSGMLLTDGINGLWIAHLIARADEVALIASRVMTLAVSAVALLVGAFAVAKLLLPAVDSWSEGKELTFGAALVALVTASFLLAVNAGRVPRN